MTSSERMSAVIVVLAIALIAAAGRGALARRRRRVRLAWSQIAAELDRRHELTADLVTMVKGYAAGDAGAIRAVTAARASAITAGASADPVAVAAAERALTRTLRALLVAAESHPALCAQDGLRAVEEQLSAIDGTLEYARGLYNACADDYNAVVEAFPARLVAGAFGLRAAVCLPGQHDASVVRGAARALDPPAGGARRG